MRRGAGFERWLLKRGIDRGVAAEWAAHVVWASGFVVGRTGHPLAVATREDLRHLQQASGDDWPDVEPAVRAWFEWVLPPGASSPAVASPLRLLRTQ
jgi:hypothetical protein